VAHEKMHLLKDKQGIIEINSENTENNNNELTEQCEELNQDPDEDMSIIIENDA